MQTSTDRWHLLSYQLPVAEVSSLDRWTLEAAARSLVADDYDGEIEVVYGQLYCAIRLHPTERYPDAMGLEVCYVQ